MLFQNGFDNLTHVLISSNIRVSGYPIFWCLTCIPAGVVGLGKLFVDVVPLFTGLSGNTLSLFYKPKVPTYLPMCLPGELLSRNRYGKIASVEQLAPSSQGKY